jgi:hypothetical protein
VSDPGGPSQDAPTYALQAIGALIVLSLVTIVVLRLYTTG